MSTTTMTFDELPKLVSCLVNEVNELKSLLQKKEQSTTIDSKTPISIKEAAKFLNVAHPTLYGYCQQSLIPHYKKSKKIYFFKDELIEWINSGKIKTVNELQDELRKKIER